MAEFVGWIACHAWWPLGWLATVWAGVGAGSPPSAHRGRVHLGSLVDVLAEGHDPVGRRYAARRLGRLWAVSPEHREDIWMLVRVGLGPATWLPPPDPGPDADISDALARFLTGPDPTARYRPAVRLVAALAGEDVDATTARQVVTLSRSARDPNARARLTDLLTRTDEPHLLAALEHAFSRGLSFGGHLWEGPDHTPTRLLTVLLDNPHLLAAPGADPLLAVLAVLRDRSDLLDRFDQREMVTRLLYLGRNAAERNGPGRAVARDILHSLGPGLAREEICRMAMHVGVASVAIGVLADAEQIAVAAGYRPADPDAEPLFLVMTHQWSRFLDVDPTGRRLRAYGLIPGPGLRYHLARLVEVLDEGRPPAAVKTATRALLRDIGDGPAAEALCHEAEMGRRPALEAVAASGIVPADERRRPVFLFRTRQWKRYDEADPDGRILRAYVEEIGPTAPERYFLTQAARDGGRPDPCETPSGPRSGGGRGVSGSGGYSGGFSVHGV